MKNIKPRNGLVAQMSRFVDHFNPGRFFLWKILASVAIYTSLVCWVDLHYFPTTRLTEINAIMSINAVFGLLLLFRNNTAYERWWEGRKLWGQLVNDSRNLAIKISSYVDTLDLAERAQIGNLIIGFAIALKNELRGISTIAPGRQLKNGCHAPSAIALELYRHLKSWRVLKRMDHWEQLQIDTHAKALMDICGGAERIQKSPIAGSYKMLLWFGLIINALAMPWCAAATFHWWSIPIMLLSSYFLFGLELLAEEIERPFDDLPNDLPLDTICETISNSVKDILQYQ